MSPGKVGCGTHCAGLWSGRRCSRRRAGGLCRRRSLVGRLRELVSSSEDLAGKEMYCWVIPACRGRACMACGTRRGGSVWWLILSSGFKSIRLVFGRRGYNEGTWGGDSLRHPPLWGSGSGSLDHRPSSVFSSKAISESMYQRRCRTRLEMDSYQGVWKLNVYVPNVHYCW